jgi:hypothetical protein
VYPHKPSEVYEALTHTQVTDSKNVLEIVRNIARMYREYLQIFTMFDDAPEEVREFWVRAILVQVGRVIEAVHRFDILRNLEKSGAKYASSGTINRFRLPNDHGWQVRRGDKVAAELYEIRNSAAHYNPAQRTAFTDRMLNSALMKMIMWLSGNGP